MLFLADLVSPPVRIHTLVTSWQTDWPSLVAYALDALLAGWYVVSTRRLRRHGRRWSPWRTASFLAGIATVVVAVGSGIGAYDDSVFADHAAQHLMLMNVAPVLLALSAPITLALQSSSRRSQRQILKVLHHPVVEFVTNPLVVLAVFSTTMVGYFLTPFYQFSLEHPLLHDFTHLHFLVSGCLFWWLVLGIDPSRWRLTYPMKIGFLAVEIPVGAVLGLGLTQTTTSIAPLFHTLHDTHVGGEILWIGTELFTLTAIASVTYRWMRSELREAARADRRADRRVAAASGMIAEGTGDGDDVRRGAREPLTPVVVRDGRFVVAEETPPTSG